MNVQASLNNSSVPFYRDGEAFEKMNETLQQDAGRSIPLAPLTLMSYDPTNADWVPFTDETAVDGTQNPTGIYLGASVTAAALVAGDVLDAPILVGGRGLAIDAGQLVIESSKTLATIINVPTNRNTTVELELRKLGIFVQATVAVQAYQQ